MTRMFTTGEFATLEPDLRRECEHWVRERLVRAKLAYQDGADLDQTEADAEADIVEMVAGLVLSGQVDGIAEFTGILPVSGVPNDGSDLPKEG